MKRMIMTLVAVWMMITSMNAQRLTNIQAEARFITDKMMVELGLSSVQRNSILTINLNYLNRHHHHPNLYRASTSSCLASTSCRACDACDACPAFLVHKLHGFRLAIPVFRSCTQGEGGACRVPSYALDTWCKYGEHTHDYSSR